MNVAGEPAANPIHMNVAMTSISGVWVGADHQCIAWCNQLIVVLASYLNLIANSVEGSDTGTGPLASFPEKVIQFARESFQEVHESDMHPGTFAELTKYGPSCPANVPEIMSSGNLQRGPNELRVSSATFVVTSVAFSVPADIEL